MVFPEHPRNFLEQFSEGSINPEWDPALLDGGVPPIPMLEVRKIWLMRTVPNFPMCKQKQKQKL